MTAVDDNGLPYCMKAPPDSPDHIWTHFHPRYDFNYRKCCNCGRKQFVIDRDTFYDPQTNQYVDRKGCHNVSDLVGYNG